MMLKPPVFVWITNKTPKLHTDKYAGCILNFVPNEPVLVPAELAQVCFGFGEDDKSRCLLRNGKLRINDNTSLQSALAWLDRFEIEEAVYAPPQGLPKGEGESRPNSARSGAGKTSQTA